MTRALYDDRGAVQGYDFGYEPKNEFQEDLANIDPYDTDHKNSMINLVPKWLKARLLNPTVKSLMSLAEEDLEDKVKPNLTLQRLRSAFWYEYERIQNAHGRHRRHEHNIGVYRMCNGICTTQYFMEKVARNDYYIAWIIRPPLDYDKALQESLQHGLNRVREILNFPLYDKKFTKDGVPVIDKFTQEQVEIPNQVTANLILKTVAFLDLRVKGAIPQKIQQYTQQQITRQSVNYNVRPDARPGDVVTVDVNALDNKLLSIEDLDDRIKQLSSETDAMVNNPQYTRTEHKDLAAKSEQELDRHAVDNQITDLTEMPIQPIESSLTACIRTPSIRKPKDKEV